MRAVDCFGDVTPIVKQEERITAYAQARGWKIVQQYVDYEESTEANKAYQQMKQDGMRRCFDLVLVDSIKTCGKTVSHAEDLLVKIFYLAGIHFVLVSSDFYSAEHDAEVVKELVHQQKCATFGETVSRYKREQSEAGFLTYHDEKYGYLLADNKKEMVVDEEAAPIIRYIFERSAMGIPSTEIAKDLNDRGIDPPGIHLAKVSRKAFRSKESGWSYCTINKILRNRNYIGEMEKSAGGRKWLVRIPMIVDEAVFQKCDALIKSRRVSERTGKSAIRNPFSNIVYDFDSGRKLSCRGVNNPYVRKQFYLAYNRTVEESHQKLRIYYDVVEKAVIKALKQEQKLAMRVIKMLSTKEATQVKEVRCVPYKRALRMVAMEMDQHLQKEIRLFMQFRDGQMEEQEYKDKKRECDAALGEKEEEFNRIVSEIERIELTFSEENPWIKHLKQYSASDGLSREQVNALVERVEIVKFKSVITTIKHREWKDQFPKEWMVE